MSPTLRADVERYIDHFRSEHEKLKDVVDPLHRKALVVTMLDALARGRYPKLRYPKMRGRNRFISLIEQHSPWPHATSVSVTQLEMMINERGGAGACGLSDEFAKRLKGPRFWKHEGLEVDPKPTDLLPTVPNEQELKIVDETKHSSLLYEYRCVLVHEYREPGHGFEFNENDTTPYYHSISSATGQHETIELVYPTGWFLELVPPILDSLAAHYFRENHNPYDSYLFGSPWRKR